MADVALRLTADIPNWRPKSKDFSQNARSGHWGRAKGAKTSWKKVGDALLVAGWPRSLPPGRFTLTFSVECARGPLMDSDAAVAVLKSCRDAVAAWLGTTDAPSGPITWLYRRQRIGPIDRVVMVLEEIP